MSQIRIDEEFRDLIPPLTDDERRGLEKSLLEEGCRDALIIWGDVLVDGHNRYEICTRHDIPFTTLSMEFESRDEAMLWMMKNQLSRRNLTTFQRLEIVEKLKPVIAEKAKENQVKAGGAVPQKSVKPVDTQKEIARLANTSHDTVAKAEKIIEEAPAPIIEATRKTVRERQADEEEGVLSGGKDRHQCQSGAALGGDRMYIGHLKEYNETPNAVIITVQSLDLLGRLDRKVYLPKSQIQIKKDPIRGYTIYIPDWLVIKNHIPWCRITEIDPISPDPNWQRLDPIGGRNYEY